MKAFRLSFGGGREATGAGYTLALLASVVTVALLFGYSLWPEPVARAVATSGFFVPLLVGISVAAGLLVFCVGWAVLRALGVPISRRAERTPLPALRAGSMTEHELDVVRENARAAPTEDLLDRVTAYRAGMEPEALRVIEEELARRGVDATAVLAHEGQNAAVLRDTSGVALMCSYCRKPAVVEEAADGIALWGGLLIDLPLLDAPRRYCEDHRPRRSPEQPEA